MFLRFSILVFVMSLPIVKNNFRNSFLYELIYMYNLMMLLDDPHEYCFLANLVDDVSRG
jgi:hypothetical protein